MQNRNELYLLVLSILLGISVLKVTELLQLADQLKIILAGEKLPNIPIAAIGTFLFLGGYIIFYVLISIACYGIVIQLSAKGATEETNDMGKVIAMAIVALAISYLVMLSTTFYSKISG